MQEESAGWDWLRATLLLLLGVAWAFTLFVRASDVLEGRHASMGIFVAPAAGDVLVVTGNRSGEEQFDGLQVGDIVLSVGGQQGLSGQIAFRHEVLAAQGELRIEREGKVMDVAVPIEWREGGGMALATTALLGALGLMVAFAGRAKQGRRRPAAVMLFGGITTGATTNGWSVEVLQLSIYLQAATSMLIGPFILNWLQAITRDDDRSALEMVWPWLFAVMGVAVYSVYMGRPIAPPLGLWLTAAIPPLIALCFVVIAVQAYPTIPAARRTQLNWLIASGAIYAILTVALFVVSSLLASPLLFQVGQSHLWLIVALGFAMSVLKADLGDVDKAVSIAVTYALLAVMLALFVEFVAEPLAGLAAAALGLSETAGQTIMIVAFALLAPIIKRRFEPRIKAYFATDT